MKKIFERFRNWLNKYINLKFITITAKIIIVGLLLSTGYSLLNTDSNLGVGVGISILVLVLAWIVAKISNVVF